MICRRAARAENRPALLQMAQPIRRYHMTTPHPDQIRVSGVPREFFPRCALLVKKIDPLRRECLRQPHRYYVVSQADEPDFEGLILESNQIRRIDVALELG